MVSASCRLGASQRTSNKQGEMVMKRQILVAAFAAATLLSVSPGIAQMRPGAKVEKTYGLGLPRDMDKLIPPDSDYPDYPLKPGQEAYKDVDGYKIKDTI